MTADTIAERIWLRAKRYRLPRITLATDQHDQSLQARFREPTPLSKDADAIERMKNRLKTAAGKAIYAQRKITPGPVLGIIKPVMGCR